MKSFSFLQIISFIFNLFTRGLSAATVALINLDPEYKRVDRKFRNAVLDLQQSQIKYCREYPESARAIARQRSIKRNDLYRQNVQVIKQEAERNKHK